MIIEINKKEIEKEIEQKLSLTISNIISKHKLSLERFATSITKQLVDDEKFLDSIKTKIIAELLYKYKKNNISD